MGTFVKFGCVFDKNWRTDTSTLKSVGRWPSLAMEVTNAPLFCVASTACGLGGLAHERGPCRDGPASGENVSHLCRLRISGYFGLEAGPSRYGAQNMREVRSGYEAQGGRLGGIVCRCPFKFGSLRPFLWVVRPYTYEHVGSEVIYVYVVPWLEFSIVLSYPHYPHGTWVRCHQVMRPKGPGWAVSRAGAL